MSPSEEEKDLRDIQELVRRANQNPDRTGTQRRETLQRLIALTNNHNIAPLKSLAARSLRIFFKDFPDLEEDVINAVYDLCEDQASEVRKDGYNAIVQVSKDQRKWVKRNADVLVQLLQSDEPDEVTVVKRALLEHIDMDPRVTLGVLCDQIAPSEDSMDIDEQARLRSLVLAFLGGEARRAIFERHASKVGSEAEDVLVAGLMSAIPRLNPKEVTMIVQELLLSLPSFKTRTHRGQELLQVLLSMATSALRDDLRPGGSASLKDSRDLLDLAMLLVTEKRLAPPADLLKLFYASLIRRTVLQKLSQDDQIWAITSTAEILAAWDHQPLESSITDQGAKVREWVIIAIPIFLEFLELSGMSDSRSWRACHIFLEAFLPQRERPNWTLPLSLGKLLHKIQDKAQRAQSDSTVKGVLKFIRLLLASPNQVQASQTNNPSVIPSTNTSSNGSGESTATSLRAENNTAARPMKNTPDANNDRAYNKSGHSFKRSASAVIDTPRAANADSDDLSRTFKRTKRDGGGDADNPPSLLSRMGSAVSPKTVPNTLLQTATPPHMRRAPPREGPRPAPPPALEKDPVVGYRFLGAATRQEKESKQDVFPEKPAPVSRMSSSLLDRMRGDSTSPGDSGGLDGRRKKRGKAS